MASELTQIRAPMKLSDEQLMLQVKQGDHDSFHELVERHKLSVLNLCLRFTKIKDDAEDLAQDIFLRIYQAAPRYENTALFSTYMYRVSLNVCLNYQRRKKILRFFSLDDEPNNGAVQPYAGSIKNLSDGSRSDAELEESEMQKIVQQAIDSLPEKQRVAVIMFRYLELSYQEIADILNTSVSAVESRLHRAKLNLKKKLEPLLKEIHES